LGFLADGSEKPTNRFFGAVTNNGLSHWRTHQLVVDREPIDAISVDCEILLIVGVDAGVDGEIVSDDLCRRLASDGFVGQQGEHHSKR
jgi:hypothetical protein